MRIELWNLYHAKLCLACGQRKKDPRSRYLGHVNNWIDALGMIRRHHRRQLRIRQYYDRSHKECTVIVLMGEGF